MVESFRPFPLLVLLRRYLPPPPPASVQPAFSTHTHTFRSTLSPLFQYGRTLHMLTDGRAYSADDDDLLEFRYIHNHLVHSYMQVILTVASWHLLLIVGPFSTRFSTMHRYIPLTFPILDQFRVAWLVRSSFRNRLFLEAKWNSRVYFSSFVSFPNYIPAYIVYPHLLCVA